MANNVPGVTVSQPADRVTVSTRSPLPIPPENNENAIVRMRGFSQSNSLSARDDECGLPFGDERGVLRSTRSTIRTRSASREMVARSAYAMYSSLSSTTTHSLAALQLNDITTIVNASFLITKPGNRGDDSTTDLLRDRARAKRRSQTSRLNTPLTDLSHDKNSWHLRQPARRFIQHAV